MKISLYFEPRDLWVGLFWDRRIVGDTGGIRPDGTRWGEVVPATQYRMHLYFCLLPTIVLRVIFDRCP